MQDMRTGKLVYNADGIRLLVSVAGKGRRMEFRVGSQAEEGEVVLTTEATAVAMDGVAAGSGGAGSVFHGRFGDGVTLSLDLAVVTERGRTGPGLFKADKKLASLFHGTGEKRGVGEAARLRLAAAARNARHPPARTGPTQPNKSSKAGRRAIAACREARARVASRRGLELWDVS